VTGLALPVVIALLVVAGAAGSYLIGLDELAIPTVPEDVRRRSFTLLGAGTMVTRGLGFAAARALAEWLPVTVVVPLAALGGLATVVVVSIRLRPERTPSGFTYRAVSKISGEHGRIRA
jgi:hypothetical protein